MIIQGTNNQNYVDELPNELLSKIFKLCVEGIAETQYQGGLPPLYIWTSIIQTYVVLSPPEVNILLKYGTSCGRWRVLGLQCGVMWSDINLMWRSKIIDGFLTLSGDQSLHLYLPLRTPNLFSKHYERYFSYLQKCAPRISGISISSDAPPWRDDGLVKALINRITSLNPPRLRTLIAIRGGSSDGSPNPPRLIPGVISPALKTIVLSGFKHPIPPSFYKGLTILRIHEVRLERAEFLVLLESHRSLQTLELSAGISQTTQYRADKRMERFQHGISSLTLGPLCAKDVEFIFRKVDFLELNQLHFFIRDELEAVQLPMAFRSLVRDTSSLKVFECRTKKLPRLVFESYPSRTYKLSFLTLSPSYSSYNWEPILSQLAISCFSSQLTALEIDIERLPDDDLWSLFFRESGSKLQHLSLTTTNMEPFLDAVVADIRLLPSLEILDLRCSTNIPKRLVEWLERREFEGGYPKLQNLLLPYQYNWDVSWRRVYGLAKDVEVLEDVLSSGTVLGVIDRWKNGLLLNS